MRQVLATLWMLGGCLLAGFGIAWFMAAGFGVIISPRSPGEMAIGFVLYGLLMMMTIDRYPSSPWLPVLRITRRRIVAARWILSMTTTLFVATMIATAAARSWGTRSAYQVFLRWMIGSALVANGVYVALHWAYRPGNLFGPRVPKWLLDPHIPLFRLLSRLVVVIKRGGDKPSQKE